MGKYLKKFENHTQYETYINSEYAVLPNVSICVQQDDVHYNPVPETKLVVKYNVTGSSTTLVNSYYDVDKIEIDGVEMELRSRYYNFPTTGEHTVKYTFKQENTVPNETFHHCYDVISVEIPNNITTIGNYAFNCCRSLRNAIIGNGVTSIGNNAFCECSAMTSVTIGHSVTSIGSGAFAGCSGLTNLIMPNTVTSIGSGACASCNGLTSFTIPSGVTTITKGLFQSCNNLTSVNIPNSVTSISETAFYQCYGLTSITISSAVTSIADNAFNYCRSLTSIIVENGNSVYDSRNNCNALIETSTNRLIQGCSATTIPNTIETIRNYAFASCSGLTSITIPSSVTTIGNYAFNNCANLYTITSLATTAPAIQNYTFNNVKNGGILYVPIGSSGYNTWMGTGNYYLGKFGWTKVEQ